MLVMFVVSKLKPDGDFELKVFNTKVDITPWKHTKLVSVITILVVVLTYLMFSPLGIAR